MKAAAGEVLVATHDCDGGCGMKDVPVDKLTEKDQKVLVSAAQKQVDGRWEYFLQEDEEYRQKMKDYGMKVLIPTEAQLKGFATKVRTEVWPELEKLMGKAIIDKARKGVGMEVK